MNNTVMPTRRAYKFCCVLVLPVLLLTAVCPVLAQAGRGTTTPIAQQPAKLMIIADERCVVTVDGMQIGTIEAEASKAVPVDIGEHLVVAKAGDIRWEWTGKITEPGQVLVRVNLVGVRAKNQANETIKALVRPWVGVWTTPDSYGPSDDRRFDTRYYQSSKFTIREDGSCEWRSESGFDLDGNTIAERRDNAIRKSSYKNSGKCIVTQNRVQMYDDNYLEIDGSQVVFKYKRTWGERTSVPAIRTRE